MVLQVRRPDDYDAKRVTDLGPSEPSASLNSLVLSQLQQPPPPPPAPVLPPAPALALPSAPAGFAPAAGGDEEDGEVVNAVVVTRVLKLEHMVGTFCRKKCGKVAPLGVMTGVSRPTGSPNRCILCASSSRTMQCFCSAGNQCA